MASSIVQQCAHCGIGFSKPVTSPPTNTRFCSVSCRFWSKVAAGDSESCWQWSAKARTQSGQGYGAFRGGDGKNIHASRMAWVLTNGEIHGGLFVCHTCDNPLCCNPAHLFLGTHLDNMLDMQAKGRNGMSEDGLERLKASKRGKPRPPEVREKLRLASLGQKHSAEHVEKTAAANRGKKRSEETKQRMREAWLRRKANWGVWLQTK